LIELYESVSGESLGKYTVKPKLKRQKLVNLLLVLNKTNEFIDKLENQNIIGTEQIASEILRN
jgi:hypothetical protein